MTSRIVNITRQRASGFTLLEMIVVIALIVIIASIGAVSFVGFDSTPDIQKPADTLARMVKQASRAAVMNGSPVIIEFDEKGFGFVGGGFEGGESARFPIPKGLKVSAKRWNGKKWGAAAGLNWTFYPSGISDALQFKFDDNSGSAEISFNPLTGSIAEQTTYVK
jgi:type II secretion system protein H